MRKCGNMTVMMMIMMPSSGTTLKIHPICGLHLCNFSSGRWTMIKTHIISFQLLWIITKTHINSFNSCRSSQRLLLTLFNTCQLKFSYHQLKESLINSRCMKLRSHHKNCSQVLALAAHGCRHIQLDEPVMMRCRIFGPHREYKRILGPQREPYSAPGTLRTPWSLV